VPAASNAARRPAGAQRRRTAPPPNAGAGRKTATKPRQGPSGRSAGGRTSARTGRDAARRRGVPARAQSARSAVTRTEPAYFVLVPTFALLLMGLVMVFSAGSVIGMGQSVGGYRYFIQQLAWAALGLGLMVFFWKFDYHKIGKVSWIGVILSIGLLALVPFYGWAAYGSKRWLSVGPVNIQPTEIAKFTLVVFAAYVLAMKGDNLKKVFHLIVPVLLVAMVEAALILKQPDLGSALVLCFSLFLILIVAKTRPGHLAAIATIGGATALYFAVAAPYRRARLFSFIDPWKAPRGAGYQVIQSYIALGSGSIKGLGLGMSRQKFLYLPNAHTDFIFAIIGEELGLIGTMVVLALVGLLAYGGMRIASRAPDELGRLLAAGITGLIVIQALVNMGGVTGLLPITGVPLPLVSSGGSSLCVCMGCIGMLMNIATQSSR
jgi:cell division protein FtsW